jgi:hypothetical protein
MPPKKPTKRPIKKTILPRCTCTCGCTRVADRFRGGKCGDCERGDHP